MARDVRACAPRSRSAAICRPSASAPSAWLEPAPGSRRSRRADDGRPELHDAGFRRVGGVPAYRGAAPPWSAAACCARRDRDRLPDPRCWRAAREARPGRAALTQGPSGGEHLVGIEHLGDHVETADPGQARSRGPGRRAGPSPACPAGCRVAADGDGRCRAAAAGAGRPARRAVPIRAPGGRSPALCGRGGQGVFGSSRRGPAASVSCSAPAWADPSANERPGRSRPPAAGRAAR